MKCHHCEVCGKQIPASATGAKLCLPIIIGTQDGQSRYCWCVCEDCKSDFVERSAKVLKELEETS